MESQPRRRSLRYANVTATLALVIALAGGTAYAASKYIITSTKQIKPSVRRALHGANGRNGTNGTNGTNGATGATGATGTPGSNLTSQTTLPSGQSESGFYAVAGATTGYLGWGITYTQPLAAAILDSNVIWNLHGVTTSQCSGYGHAAPGYLCLYDFSESSVSFDLVHSAGYGFSTPSAGVIFYWNSTGAGSYVEGEWTVTAP